MRWATYRHPGGDEDRVGLVVDERLYGLPQGVTLLELLGDPDRLAEAGAHAGDDPAEVVSVDEVRLSAPIPRPPAVRDFSAFEQHVTNARRARGLGIDPAWYEQPVFYFSNPHAIVATGADVAVPPGSSALDYELEVAAVVGLAGRDLAPEQATRHIAGFTVLNDWSARDLQRREMALQLGPVKGKDFATTLGPHLVTPDELEPHAAGQAYDLTMTARVNGREYSRANLADVHWSFGEMVAHASRGTWVSPGDVIGSGAAGTGCILELSLLHGHDAYPWLEPGDEVTLEVERLGAITNRVVEGRPLQPLRR
ncbi:MAG TPA: fumarylacetoacetate hydrolase family protein [Nitriliruptorales bacterium]|nr:fumarylacetoacetate hydrolase family protein [Nitriliruptorales bacterium]